MSKEVVFHAHGLCCICSLCLLNIHAACACSSSMYLKMKRPYCNQHNCAQKLYFQKNVCSFLDAQAGRSHHYSARNCWHLGLVQVGELKGVSRIPSLWQVVHYGGSRSSLSSARKWSTGYNTTTSITSSSFSSDWLATEGLASCLTLADLHIQTRNTRARSVQVIQLQKRQRVEEAMLHDLAAISPYFAYLCHKFLIKILAFLSLLFGSLAPAW